MLTAFVLPFEGHARKCEMLGEGTEEWNSLFEPVEKTCYPEIVNVLEELKASEERNVELAKCLADRV